MNLVSLLFTRILSSSEAKQKAKGGCQRQIKSLMLMHCGNMEKIKAAQAQFGGISSDY